MPEFTFRLSGRLPDDVRLEVPHPELDLSGSHHEDLSLRSTGGGTLISESEYLILRGAGYASEEAALRAGEFYRDFLTLALAGIRIAADFGDRAPRSGFTGTGLVMLERDQGKTVLDNVLGLTVYESSLKPLFASFSGKVVIGKSPIEFEQLFGLAVTQGSTLDERERLAYDLYSSSFFQPSQDARLMLLITSIEALVDPRPRPPSSLSHVEHLSDLTGTNEELEEAEKDSLLGALSWLTDESIGQAGRRLASERLQGKEYGDEDAGRFFTRAYELRSRLLHSSQPFPNRKEIVGILPALEEFVADMICLPHLASAI